MANILIVEDHQLVADAMVFFLEKYGCKVVAIVDNEADALSTLATLRPSPEVAIVDLNLLHKEFGLPLVSKIGALYPEVGVVIYSMRENPQTIDAAYRAGALAYVSKSKPTEVLLEAVNAAIKKTRYYPPGVAEELATLHADGKGGNPGLVLSDKEQEVFLLAARGQTNESIAQHLGISAKRVANLIVEIKKKINAERDQFLGVAVHYGLLSLDL